MGTFMTAYMAVWLAVVLFIGRLGVRQRRLQRALDKLQEQLPDESNKTQSPAKAA